MNAATTVDTSTFQAALRKHLATTSRGLKVALNMRMAYVLMRAYLSLDPKDPHTQRGIVRKKLTEEIGERKFLVMSGRGAGKLKRKGKARQFQARHRILQWLRAKAGKPGLYGEEMRIESGKFLGRRTSSVGGLKAVVVKMIRGFMPSFTQFGGTSKKHAGKSITPNAALIAMAGQYGHAATNVGVARNSKVKASPAEDGFNPKAVAFASIGVNDGQEGRVEARYNAAMQRAFNDERDQMLAHMAGTVLDSAEAAGFQVK